MALIGRHKRGSMTGPGRPDQSNATAITQTVQDKAGEGAGVVGQQAAEVADTAREQAGKVAQEAAEQARELAGGLREQLQEQTAAQTQRLAQNVRRLAGEESISLWLRGGSPEQSRICRYPTRRGTGRNSMFRFQTPCGVGIAAGRPGFFRLEVPSHPVGIDKGAGPCSRPE